MDHPHYRQICGLDEANDGGLHEAVELWCAVGDQCLQHVSCLSLRWVYRSRYGYWLTIYILQSPPSSPSRVLEFWIRATRQTYLLVR